MFGQLQIQACGLEGVEEGGRGWNLEVPGKMLERRRTPGGRSGAAMVEVGLAES